MPQEGAPTFIVSQLTCIVWTWSKKL